ncbi:uncharacterized protein [Antedon mediterranea]|uniref:uncharacterized protein n=1 Tax=Antedon mediterranea TaxID=105859 RepID=UPI003AF6DC6D
MNSMDSWVDYDDGLLNGMKDHCLLAVPSDFGDNLETKPLLDDIDSYLNKNSALITSKEQAEESVGSCYQPNVGQEKKYSHDKCLVKNYVNTKVFIDNGVINSSNVKQEPNHNKAMLFTPFMVAPGIMGFNTSVQPILKPVKRGRPRIHPIKPDIGIKRKPGRPRIHPVKPSDGIKRKPGRPRIHPQPCEKLPVSHVIRHIRPKPDPSLMAFTGPIPHTFIPSMNTIQIPKPPPTLRYLPAVDPITGKRKRGRPRIHPVKINDGIKRKPGRPKKVLLLPNNETIKALPSPVVKHEANIDNKQFCPMAKGSESIEKRNVVCRFSIEAEVQNNECKPFMCVACGDCFCTSDELMLHVVKHEEETECM